MEIKLGELGEVSFGILMQKVPEAEQLNDTGVFMIMNPVPVAILNPIRTV